MATQGAPVFGASAIAVVDVEDQPAPDVVVKGVTGGLISLLIETRLTWDKYTVPNVLQ